MMVMAGDSGLKKDTHTYNEWWCIKVSKNGKNIDGYVFYIHTFVAFNGKINEAKSLKLDILKLIAIL